MVMFKGKRPCNMLCLQIDMVLSSSTIMMREAGLTKKGVDRERKTVIKSSLTASCTIKNHITVVMNGNSTK